MLGVARYRKLSARSQEYLIRRNSASSDDPRDAKPTGISANTEDERRANVIAKRNNLTKVQKGTSWGWTPVVRIALERAADEDTVIAAIERHCAEREKFWAEKYDALARDYRQLLRRRMPK